jgi:uncharacterized membrane protein
MQVFLFFTKMLTLKDHLHRQLSVFMKYALTIIFLPLTFFAYTQPANKFR